MDSSRLSEHRYICLSLFSFVASVLFPSPALSGRWLSLSALRDPTPSGVSTALLRLLWFPCGLSSVHSGFTRVHVQGAPPPHGWCGCPSRVLSVALPSPALPREASPSLVPLPSVFSLPSVLWPILRGESRCSFLKHFRCHRRGEMMASGLSNCRSGNCKSLLVFKTG